MLDRALGGTDPDYKIPGAMNDTSYQLVQGKLKLFGLNNVELIQGFFEQTFPHFSSLVLSFVHLDCDAYQAYKECLEFIYPRLSPGGVILFDEYNDPPWPGCNKAVDEFLAGKPEQLESITKDNRIKYFFVKQTPAATVSSVVCNGASSLAAHPPDFHP